MDVFVKMINDQKPDSAGKIQLTVADDLVTANPTTLLSANQGVLIDAKISDILSILSSDDVNIDTLQKVVDALKLIDGSSSIILVDDLVTGGPTKSLTAEQGKILKLLIDSLGLQAVVDINKTANKLELVRNIEVFGKAVGQYTFPSSTVLDTLDSQKFYLYGDFNTYDDVAYGMIGRINLSDFSEDLTFDTGTGFNAMPYGGSILAVHPNGDLYVGGWFTLYNNIAANRIISLKPDGTKNATFNYGTGFNGFTTGVTLNKANTHIYVGGLYNDYNGIAANRIIRLALDGTKDNTFNYGAGFDNTTIGIFVDADESVFVTGYFNNYNGSSSPKIVKILPDGSRDASFNVGTGFNTGNNQPGYIKRLSSGLLVATGYFTMYNGVSANRIVILNNDGSINTSFNDNIGTGFNNVTELITETADGKIVISGDFTSYNGKTSYATIMLNADFSINTTYSVDYIGASRVIGNKVLGWDYSNVNYDRIYDINVGLSAAKRRFNFHETTGKVEYFTDSLMLTGPNEILSKKLIEELINGQIKENVPAQTLQQVLDAGNYAEYDNGYSYIKILTGVQNDKKFDVQIGESYDKYSEFLVNQTLVYLYNTILTGGYSSIDLSDGRVRLTESNSTNTFDTQFRIKPPISNTSVKIPSKSIMGDYTIDVTPDTIYTVGTLPTGVLNDKAIVSDATSPTYLGTLTGGGVIVCPVWHNGTNWVSN